MEMEHCHVCFLDFLKTHYDDKHLKAIDQFIFL